MTVSMEETDAQLAYRESLFEFGWAIEVFVHNLTSYKDFFQEAVRSAQSGSGNRGKVFLTMS